MEERKNAKTEQNTNEQNTQNANKNAKNTKNSHAQTESRGFCRGSFTAF